MHLLYPGDIFIERRPYIVSTVLGSCVSVCLHAPSMQMGTINHYILPQWNGVDLATMKYGNLSIIRILEGLLRFGCTYKDIEAKVLGGAEVLVGTSTRFHIGQRNIDIALKMLQEFGIPVALINVGGDKGRKIIFNTQTGEVECLYINRRERFTPEDMLPFFK